jgi:1-acyl-sn-glycerol-3-phosphate acyltransferase
MTRGDRRRGHDAIRTAAWQSASASGVTEARNGTPPLSASATAAASSRARQARQEAPPTPPRADGNTSRRAPSRRVAFPVDTHPTKPAPSPGNGGSRRGHAPDEFAELVGEDEDWRENPSAAQRFGERILDVIASGSLDSRDPDLIRESLPLNWLLATLYFRAKVDGIENIPSEGPALLVGNHSGGNYIPDAFILGMAFATYFGAERPWYALTHSAAMTFPVIGRILRALGSIPATRDNAVEALERGACVLVYPGGDIETYRPWRERNQVKFAGRMGFIRTALQNRVPLIPVANVGSHETGIFLSDGQWLCRLLGLDRRFRIKATPIQLAIPWGLYATDFLPRLLLPAKIEIRVLPEIQFDRTGPEAAADNEYVRECYQRVTHALQEAVTEMASRRRWPIIG